MLKQNKELTIMVQYSNSQSCDYRKLKRNSGQQKPGSGKTKKMITQQSLATVTHIEWCNLQILNNNQLEHIYEKWL